DRRLGERAGFGDPDRPGPGADLRRGFAALGDGVRDRVVVSDLTEAEPPSTRREAQVIGSAPVAHCSTVCYNRAMANRITLNVSLTPELEKFIDARVSSGRYQSASEVVRE